MFYCNEGEGRNTTLTQQGSFPNGDNTTYIWQLLLPSGQYLGKRLSALESHGNCLFNSPVSASISRCQSSNVQPLLESSYLPEPSAMYRPLTNDKPAALSGHHTWSSLGFYGSLQLVSRLISPGTLGSANQQRLSH